MSAAPVRPELAALLAHPAAGRRAAGAPAADIAALATRLGMPLPDGLRAFWQASDGLPLPTLNMHLLAPADVLLLLADDAWPEEPPMGDWLPLLEDLEGAWLALAVRGPLVPRVLHVPHDDEPQVLFADLDSLWRHLRAGLDAGEFELRGHHGDYAPEAPRSAADGAAARALLAGDSASGEWNLAAQLLETDDGARTLWARLLETDHFVRRDVRARLASAPLPPALRALLADDTEAFRAFAAELAQAARAAGLRVQEVRDDALQIDGRWFLVEGFFYRRHIPDALPRLLAWIEDCLQQRDPRGRPRHFMSD